MISVSNSQPSSVRTASFSSSPRVSPVQQLENSVWLPDSNAATKARPPPAAIARGACAVIATRSGAIEARPFASTSSTSTWFGWSSVTSARFGLVKAMLVGSSISVTPLASCAWTVWITTRRLRLTTLIESEMWFTTKTSSSPPTPPGSTATLVGSWPTRISASRFGRIGFVTSSTDSMPDVVLAT
jgi:hypothetical protein